MESSEEKEWKETITEFKNAIQEINQPFDQFFWLQTLFRTGLNYLLYKIRLKPLLEYCKRNRGHLFQFIPLFAIMIVCAVVLGYDLILHDYVFGKRREEEGESVEELEEMTKTSQYHLLFVHYIALMIIWNYLQTTFTSPGILVHVPSIHDNNTTKQKNEEENCSSTQTMNKSKNDNELNQSQNTTCTTTKSNCDQYHSISGQGGCCYISPKLNLNHEQNLVSFYKSTFDPSYQYYPSLDSNAVFIPKANTSYCEKCQLVRPPRSHHCSRFKRCVLQMDHHCIWINNCIGYNNYRYFFLTLFFLVVGCWYGLSILSRPYWDILHMRYTSQQVHGNLELNFIYEIIKQGKLGLIIRIPTPVMIYNEIKGEGNDVGFHPELMMDIIFPFLVITGMSLSHFFYIHCKYVFSGLTTLEHMATLKFKKKQALVKTRLHKQQQQSRSANDKDEDDEATYQKFCHMEIVNPFDQGPWLNFRTVMGRWIVLALLPIRQNSLPPYVPSCDLIRGSTSNMVGKGHLKTS